MLDKPEKKAAEPIEESKWTQFMDMHSGGGSKLQWEYIYIEAPSAVNFED